MDSEKAQRHQYVGSKGGFRNIMKGAVLKHSFKHNKNKKNDVIDLLPPDKRNG